MEIVITRKTLSIVPCHSTWPLVYLLEGSRKVTEELRLARLDSDLDPERRAVMSVWLPLELRTSPATDFFRIGRTVVGSEELEDRGSSSVSESMLGCDWLLLRTSPDLLGLKMSS